MKKTAAEAKKTRVKILNSALNLFTQKGFEKTSLDEISKKAGFTRGAAYTHFKSKEDILQTLLLGLETQDKSIWKKASEKETHGKKILFKYLEMTFQELEEDTFKQKMQKLLFSDPFTKSIQSKLLHLLELDLDDTENFLKTLRKEITINPKDGATLLVATLLGLEVLRIQLPQRLNLLKIRKPLLKYLSDGLFHD